MELSPRFLRVYEGEWKPSWADRAAAAKKRAEAMPELGLNADELGAPEYIMPLTMADWWGSSHMQNFISCVRSRQTPNCGVDRAFEEAVTIAMSVQSHKTQRKVRWDAVKEEIVAI